ACARLLPLLRDVGEEAGAARTLLREPLIAAISVTADRRDRDHGARRMRERRECSAQEPRALDPALADAGALRGGPAAFADGLAREVDDRVEPVEARAVERAAFGVPEHVARGAARTAREAARGPALRVEPSHQRAADQAGGAAHEHGPGGVAPTHAGSVRCGVAVRGAPPARSGLRTTSSPSRS